VNEKAKKISVFLKNNQWFLMFLSVVFGIIATMLVHIYIRNRVLSISGGGFVPVIVVAKDMNEGEIITEDCILRRDMPASVIHNKIITEQYKDFIIGQKAGTNLFENQPLLWNDIAIEKPTALSQKLKPRERAISLFVDDATGLKGLLKPGDRVDVVGYFDIVDEDMRSVQSVAKVVLQNILVLAVGNNMSPSIYNYGPVDNQRSGQDTGQQSASNTVTLRVNVVDVPMLIFAEKKGEIFLSLRSNEDIIVEPIQDADFKELRQFDSAFNKIDIMKKEGYPVIYEGGKEKQNVFMPSDNFVKETAPYIPELKEQVQKIMEEKKAESEKDKQTKN
jgi:pilus assembly protein CpaB